MKLGPDHVFPGDVGPCWHVSFTIRRGNIWLRTVFLFKTPLFSLILKVIFFKDRTSSKREGWLSQKTLPAVCGFVCVHLLALLADSSGWT